MSSLFVYAKNKCKSANDLQGSVRESTRKMNKLQLKKMPTFNIVKPTSVNQLDHKLLLAILSYVPNRREAALVNKSFYEAVCEVDFNEDIYKLVFDGAIDQSDIAAISASMRSSKRKVKEIEVQGVFFDDEIYEFFIKVFSKFGSTTKKLNINRIVIDEARMCAILGMCRNVEEVALTQTRLCHRSDPFFNFNLTHLKKLDLTRTYCSEVHVGKKGRHFIDELMKMVVRGTPIEDLQADLNFLEKFNFEKRKLKSLAMHKVNPAQLRISSVISAQCNLQSLDLMGCFFMDDVLLAIKRDLPGLRILKIPLGGLSCNTFAQVIPKMKHLSELHIEAGRVQWLPTAFGGKELPNVGTLYLNVDQLFAMSQGVFQVIFEAFPNVEKLHLVTNYTSCFNAIFKCRVHMPLKHCTVQFSNLQQASPRPLSPKFARRDVTLKELRIINSDAEFAKNADFNFLSHFVNLEKLIITGFILNPSIHHYALMLRSLVHLELAEFGVGSDYIIDESIEKMINYKRKLKFMKVECDKAVLKSASTGKKFPLIYRRGVEQIFRQR